MHAYGLSKLMRLVIAVSTVLFLISSSFATDNGAVASAKSACGTKNVHYEVHTDENSHSPAQPEPGRAQIYMIEDQGPGLHLAHITTRVGLDGAWVGANQGNSYFVLPVSPGEHHLCANWQSSSSFSKRFSFISFTAEAGRIYYFRVRARVDLFDLELINSDEGQFLVTSFALSNFKARD